MDICDLIGHPFKKIRVKENDTIYCPTKGCKYNSKPKYSGSYSKGWGHSSGGIDAEMFFEDYPNGNCPECNSKMIFAMTPAEECELCGCIRTLV